jgi:hypothetical protein
MKPWKLVLNPNGPLGRPVYITSDNINTPTEDWNRMAAICNLLISWGLNAYGWGLGPDTQNSVMRDVKVPQNALVVNIYGGACAGTIYAMTGSYYLGIKGARKVYCIWISPPAWDITNLPTKAINGGKNFLPRAHDDTFSKYLPNWGYNSKGQWTDGLNNPDQFLINNGYHFMVTNGNILEMATGIYDEAVL